MTGEKRKMQYDTAPFRQVTVALNTPFTPGGEVDLPAVGRLVEYLKAKGVKSIYVCGSTGEGFLLTEAERMAVAEAAINAAAGAMQVIVHVGAPATRHSVALARHAEQAGANATSAVPSVYYRLGEESVYRHWTAITEAADLPFFIYNIPQLTGFHLGMPLLHRMLENPRVAGVKCSSEAAHDILRYKQAGGEDFLVFNGPDEQYLAGRVMGADAGIGGTYAAMPALYLGLEEAIRAGEWEKAREKQATITAFIDRLLGFGSLYGAVKALLRLDGCDIGDPRAPFLPVDHKDPALAALYKDIRAASEGG